MLLKVLKSITDSRRKQARQFDQAHILLISILAILSGANSYRRIEIFIRNRFKKLKKNTNSNGDIHHHIQRSEESF